MFSELVFLRRISKRSLGHILVAVAVLIIVSALNGRAGATTDHVAQSRSDKIQLKSGVVMESPKYLVVVISDETGIWQTFRLI